MIIEQCGRCGKKLSEQLFEGHVDWETDAAVCSLCAVVGICDSCGRNTWLEVYANNEMCGECLYSAYTSRGNYLSNPHERPTQIILKYEQVPDLIIMNGWIKDILGIALRKVPVQSESAIAIQGYIDGLSDINLLVQSKGKMREKAIKLTGSSAPILLSKADSSFYYKILDLAEHAYGKNIRDWFLTKERSEWRRWRLVLYQSAWNLGHIIRNGTMAVSTSPMITGMRKPGMGGDDPFGETPIGME